MADGDRVVKLRDAALILADDAAKLALRLNKYVRAGRYDAAREAAADLQRNARDVKWLMLRQSKE